MAHLQYMPGDPRLVDQLVYELKSKGIFDQFRKECIADVDTRPAYQNLRQRVENSVAAFLSRQCWKPDLNKNQLREKLRKHILDGNYLEQGVERIVDQVVNPKVASVFIPQVEDLVYNYLGIARKKPTPETSNDKVNDNDLLPTDLEAVSPGSVKSNDDKVESMDEVKDESMDIDQVDKDDKIQVKDDNSAVFETAEKDKIEPSDTQVSVVSELTLEPEISIDKSTIPLPDELKAEDIPPPENSPPNIDIDKIELPPKIDVDKIELPKEPDLCLNFSTNPTDIPLPDEGPKSKTESYFKPNNLNSEDEDSSSSDSSLIRNMSPLTPIRNFNNENSCDAQQGFENDSDTKSDDKKEPSSFRFALEAKSPEDSSDKSEKKEAEQSALAYKFDNQVNINTYNTPVYEDSSNSNNLQIDYESDANSKMVEVKPDAENSVDTKKESKVEAKKSVHKSSQSSRDSHRHSSSKDRRSDSKHSNSRDNSRHDKKSSKDDKSKSNKDRERSRDRTDKKDSRDSSKHRSSHKSSNYRDSKTHRSSTSSSRHSSKPDDKKDKSSRNDKSSDRSKDKKDSKSSSSKSEKDKKSNNNNKNEKEKKKEKKDNDDHYSVSGRGNHTRRSTDRDSNDGSSSSKGSNLPSSKNSSSKKESKSSSAKSDNTSTSSESTSPSDKDVVANVESESKASQNKPVVRVENQLEVPISTPPRLPFVPDVTLKKPKFAANLEEAKRFMKMRKFLDEEQKRMNQEAALLLEFQANVRPSLSQVYSSIPGPELEFACVSNPVVLESRVMYEIPVANTNIIEPVVPTGKVINAITYEIPRTDSIVQNEVQDTNIVNIPLVTPKIDIEQPVKIVSDSIDEPCHDTQEIDTDRNLAQEADVIDVGSHIETKVNSSETYNENKPFSQLVDEISEYSKASEKLRNEKTTTKAEIDDISKPNTSEEVNKKVKEFEVTIITEEISESEDFDKDKTEITLPEDIKDLNEIPLQYFAEHEKYDAEISRLQFGTFFKDYVEKTTVCNKLYLVNCDTYEESVIKDVLKDFGEYEIVNYYKNGHLKLPKKTKNIVKDVNLSSEISLPVDNNEISNIEVEKHSPVFSPVKSDCSFELTSDYTAKLEEMVNKTSRQQVMEIILGSLIEQSTDEMPKIDYCMDVSIEENNGLKRKMEVESTENNNSCVLTPTKLRKLSDSDQISSTTEEADEFTNNNKIPNNGRSRYLGRARRVGLPRPRKTNPSNSPSSDKSVENYEQNTQTPPQTPNGKIKTPQRKVQRYDTSDLYKPKLHYLSRRNNVT